MATRDEIYLAALLHDIGKFYQRFDPEAVEKSKYLTNEIKNLESTYCPYNSKGNYYSHKHVLWTAQFFHDHKNKINTVFGLESSSDRLMTLAASHHNPDKNNKLALIIQQADILSSAAEREEKKQEVKDYEKSWNFFKKVPLKSIFDIVSIKEKQYPQYATHPIETNPLEIKKLPISDDLNYIPNYAIWENFVNEFKQIPSSLSPQNFLETLDSLLHRYTYCIPSSTVDEPDISLYDHLKTTAFLAIALYDYCTENEDLELQLDDKEKPFVLLGGDISGIQDFIYDIPNEGAAKQLKARSFYLHLITETIVRKILKDFNLLHINVVYSSGGNFYILLPNLKNVNTRIRELNQEINEQLRQFHDTNIYLAMDYEEIAIENLKQKNCSNDPHAPKCLSQIWDNLISEKINRVKNQRYFYALNSCYEDFFIPSFAKNDKQQKDIINKLEILGKNLKKAKYLVFAEKDQSNIKKEFEFLTLAGIHVYLYNHNPAGEFTNAEIIKLNDTKLTEDIINNNSYRFEFYGGNDYPIDEQGYPKTFDKLAQGYNLDRLGILRMDVDNLGKIFAEGFEPRLRTFSRLTALSRNLDFFFKGYLNTIWNQDKYKEETYILYSGGDDLFILGRWDKIIEFAYEIRQQFKEFTRSTSFGLSGGISIEKPKYPIRRAAYNAGRLEKIAKDFEIDTQRIDSNYEEPHKKNSLYLLGTPLSWQSDFLKVLELKNIIKNHLQDKKSLSHAFFNTIKMLYIMQDQQQKNKKTESWRWLSAYYLQRTSERLGKNNKDFINDLKISIFTDNYKIGSKHESLNSNYTFLKLLAIAARWAELEIRTEKVEANA